MLLCIWWFRMNTTLDTEEVKYLALLVEEATRSTEEGIKRFVEPAPGTLRRAKSRQHHMIFGRRGSGKTSLLRKAAKDLKIDSRPIANVDLETFKGHSYPDVLLSTLIVSFEGFNKWLNSAMPVLSYKTILWSKLSRKKLEPPILNRKQCSNLISALTKQIEKLKMQLHLVDNARISRTTKQGQVIVEQNEIGTRIGSQEIGFSGKKSGTEKLSTSEEITEAFHRSKINFLNRNIVEYKKIFREMSELSGGGSYLFLDDLYHIKKVDQAKVLDYFHRIAKGSDLWLKIGTIRHRTVHYIPGDPPIGIKIGDDADQIDLDLSLEKYHLTKGFLVEILNKFVTESGLRSIRDIMTDDAINRLVLASGGVARDFLGVFRRSIDFALERGISFRGPKRRRAGPKICVEDVNKAAGEYDSIKRSEFKKDIPHDDQSTLEGQFNRIRDFCIDQANANLFLLNKNASGEEIALIKELVDLRLIHLVKSRVTVSSRPKETFEVYMLDVSQYTGSRKKRGLSIIEFWKESAKESLRRTGLIYNPSN
jgi:Cdc6-like AAA superfamily ATPase